MTWKEYEVIQKQICKKFGSKFLSTSPDYIIGLATKIQFTPIYDGIRNLNKRCLV